ncbi:DUF4386 domain-containing protein [Aliiglaciecola sp. CAU 1673]|uniref:DUF4386 domain-containing protein n=1 Tax=Aliiglaciecola sp. CAU 1673 TaxID=3032595 RepID=UPI0023DC241A|nr:DUF4386 domain-containing protein [Aliiglaciecola sp. CAU 1673]MDF2176881.1 DUF4386 domain-containing protein [Aliiglaciecola sp. CAU 1673]
MTKKSTARLAGVVYLLVVLTGIFNLLYVPSQLIAWGDAATTVSNIMSSELLYRSGIVAGVFSYIFFLILPFLMFALFKEVNRTAAILMVILAAVSAPISLFNMINKVDVLTLLSGAPYLSALSAEQIQAQVMLLLHSYNNGIKVVQIFWGLWLFPLGFLIFKSGCMPKILGILLMVGCFGYLTLFLGTLLFPDVSLPGFISKPASLGEIGTCLWLLVMGVKERPAQHP